MTEPAEPRTVANTSQTAEREDKRVVSFGSTTTGRSYQGSKRSSKSSEPRDDDDDLHSSSQSASPTPSGSEIPHSPAAYPRSAVYDKRPLRDGLSLSTSHFRHITVPESQFTSTMIQLYRGELSRMLTYRLRLDTTTNWAVTVTGVLMVFSLGDETLHHSFHIFILFFVLMFLIIEAQRYRYYLISHSRVRELELGFYGQILGDERGRWEERLLESLRYPTIRLTTFQACIVRLRRTFGWLVTAVLASWLYKMVDDGDFNLTAVIVVGVLYFFMLLMLCFVSTSEDFFSD